MVNACNVYLDPLVKLQKNCLRIITFSNYLEHTEPLFQNLEVLNFQKLVIHRIAMLMFKNSKQMVPIADIHNDNAQIWITSRGSTSCQTGS